MGWQDRDYNAGREEMRAYMANPGAMLQYAFPLYTSRTLHIRLQFWFLLAMLFDAIRILRVGAPFYYILLDFAVSLLAILWHEFGHMVFARMVGGNHWEWIVWPLNGMVTPTAPHTAKATFVANIGGIVFSTFAVVAAIGGIFAMSAAARIATPFGDSFFPFTTLPSPAIAGTLIGIAGYCLVNLALTSAMIVLFNLFPAFLFDGGHIWSSILWPKLGLWKALRITCLVGMILAVPLLLLSLYGTNLLGVIFWALIFADCFRRRHALAAAGPGVMDDDDTPAYNYMDTPEKPRRKKLKKRWLTNARKRALQDQAERARIDAILAKVKEKGLHSLTWWEKRTLRKATERQRQHDLAERR